MRIKPDPKDLVTVNVHISGSCSCGWSDSGTISVPIIRGTHGTVSRTYVCPDCGKHVVCSGSASA